MAKKIDDAEKALTIFFQFPVINIQELAEKLNKSYNTAAQLIEHFVDLKILQENEKQKRNKLFYFNTYLELLEKEYPDQVVL